VLMGLAYLAFVSLGLLSRNRGVFRQAAIPP